MFSLVLVCCLADCVGLLMDSGVCIVDVCCGVSVNSVGMRHSDVD